MIYTDQTRKAMKLMFKAHAGQVDRAGVPYIFHPWHVAESMPDEDSTIAALLHDVVEDTDLTLNDLNEFPPRVLIALTLLTHDPKVEYMDYIRALAKNPIAKRVKLADLEHNSDLTRIPDPGPEDYARVVKYKQAIGVLLNEE